MQKFIRIALPCVCFAVFIWWCCFNGFQYIHWKWLILAAGIGAVCYIGLYVKLHKLQKQKEEHLCLLKKQAEEAVAPELEKVKGNWLKKEMIKRRMVKEYLEKNTDYYANAYDNNAISKVQDWISSLWWSLYLLCLPFASIIIWVLVAILMALLFYWSFSNEMAICCAFSVAASIILVWRRYNECLGNSFSMGTIYRYIYGRMCIDFGKKHSILIRGYWHRFFCNELHRLLCAYLDQRAFQLDIIRNNKGTN